MLNQRASGRTNLWQISRVPWVLLLREEVAGLVQVQINSPFLNMNEFTVFKRTGLNFAYVENKCT